MRKPLPERLEAARYNLGSHRGDGAYGAFQLRGPCGEDLRIIASGADHPDDDISQGWEHVSVSKARNPPNWREMCFVKNLFWGPEECVVQFHPPEVDYVNNHPNVLHLWRHITVEFPRPPAIMVGIKDLGTLTKEQAHAINKARGLFTAQD
jgi:hypothetical protein